MSILYVVGTPIGNLGDMSPRAIETLESVDFIAAEDTRVTLKLLNHFNIKKPMISYFEHNKAERGEIICAKILGGQSCALVTDAGMPAISDPGEELVRQCRDKGIKTVAVPGPSAVVSALALSSLPTGRFTATVGRCPAPWPRRLPQESAPADDFHQTPSHPSRTHAPPLW